MSTIYGEGFVADRLPEPPRKAVKLPDFPVLPAKFADRALWVRWATEAVLAERERAARVCEAYAAEAWGHDKAGALWCADAIRRQE